MMATRSWCGLVLATVLAGVSPAYGNDSASSKTAGGIVLKHEARISMEKEKLSVGPGTKPHDPNIYYRITVEYEFLNESDEDITTEVAFPVPPYNAGENITAAGMRDFNEFQLWVEGKPLPYETEAKAFLEKKVGGKSEVTAILQQYHIDIASLGHLYNSENSPDGSSAEIEKISPAVRKKLSDMGLVDLQYNEPLWEVAKTYHWQQTFPAHAVLHVKHSYLAAHGFHPLEEKLFDPVEQKKAMSSYRQSIAQGKADRAFNPTGDISMIKEACVDSNLSRRLTADAKAKLAKSPGDNAYVEGSWVDYILTTANNWKTPIKSFELDIEKPKTGTFVSLCWDGPVQRVDETRFRMIRSGFVPDRDLHVLFVEP